MGLFDWSRKKKPGIKNLRYFSFDNKKIVEIEVEYLHKETTIFSFYYVGTLWLMV
jgi:hypothetical protein